jgi:hypothetical protein
MAKSESTFAQKTCVTPVGRLSFPSLAKPDTSQGEPTFKCDLIFEPGTDLKDLQRIAKFAWDEGTSGKKPFPKIMTIPKVGTGSPFRKGTSVGDRPEYPQDSIFIRPTTKKQPKLFDRKMQPIEDAEADLYGGCYVRLELVATYYEVSGNTGVKFTLLGVQKIREGDAFGGGRNATALTAMDDDIDEDESFDSDDSNDFGF